MQRLLDELVAVHDISCHNALKTINKWGPEYYIDLRKKFRRLNIPWCAPTRKPV